MGFRNGAYCTVWEAKPKSDTLTDLRITINRKDKNTGEWVPEFSGFVTVVGSAAAKKAAALKEKDRIKLGDVDVSNSYNKETKVTYTNFKIFSFEMADGASQTTTQPTKAERAYEGEPDDSNLPF